MHKMKIIVILSVSIIMVILGLLIEDRGLAMSMGNDGQLVFPISSGSEDGFLLKLASLLFLFSAIAAAVTIFCNKGGKATNLVFWANQAFFIVCVLLVSLDSSILLAAQLGDFLPLLALALCIGGAVLVSFNNRLNSKNA